MPQLTHTIDARIGHTDIIDVSWWKANFFPYVDTSQLSDTFYIDRLRAARSELETELQIHFEPTTILGEKHDYYVNDFRQTFWMNQCFWFPIRAVQRMVLKYNQQVVAEVDNDWVLINENFGTVELLPSATGQTGFIYTALISGLRGIASTIYGGYDRIPCFFTIDYVSGIDWNNITIAEQQEFLQAIGRRCAINTLPVLDNKMGVSAESISIDGASESVSYTASAMYGQYSAQIEQYKKDDREWINRMRRRYGKDLAVVVT